MIDVVTSPATGGDLFMWAWQTTELTFLVADLNLDL